jgi:hypothetical protein
MTTNHKSERKVDDDDYNAKVASDLRTLAVARRVPYFA